MALHKALKEAGLDPSSSSDLFKDFHNLQGVWTHPLMLDMKKNYEKVYESDNDDHDDESENERDSMDDEHHSSDSEENLHQPGPSEY